MLTLTALCLLASPLSDSFGDPALPGWSHRQNAALAVDDGALRFSADFAQDAYAWAYLTPAQPVDGTALAGVSFQIRGDGSSHELQLVLKSGDRQWTATPGHLLEQTEWQEVFVPLSSFRGLDRPARQRLTTIGFALFRRNEGRAATVWLDDLKAVPVDAIAPAPRLTEPADNHAAGQVPTLAWQAVDRATGYELQVSPQADFAGAIGRPVTALSLRPDDLPEGIWYWRVRASGEPFLMGDWSAARRFTVDTTPPRVLAVSGLPELITIEFDDLIAAAPKVTVAGSALAAEPLVSDRLVTVRPATPLLAGGHTVTISGAVNAVGLAQEATVERLAQVPEWLPYVVDRSADLSRDRVRREDLDWWGREAAGAGNHLSNALLATAWIANSIDGVVGSETFGWQASHRYRSSPDNRASWDTPSNARIMEAIYTPLLAYALDRPWNPYHRDPNLRRRLEAGFDYWLRLQGPEGGFPEYGGFGSQELPSTSFGLEFLIEVHELLADDPTFDEGIKARLLDALRRACVWAATPGPRSTVQGFHFSNQYCGALYGMVRLWQLTGEEEWKRLYDERLDDWIANAQQLDFWYEADGCETFGYSRITEWELDRILVVHEDPRLVETLRRYYEWCALNTVPEADGRTFIMDNLGHARTSAQSPGDSVGYFNHIATRLPIARPWTTAFVMDEAEHQRRIDDWFTGELPADRAFPRRPYAYNPFSQWMTFAPHGLWTITEEERQAALAELPTLARERFSLWRPSPWGNDQYLFVRRDGVYATFHAGSPNSNQGKEIGLIWLPRFGTLLRSYNNSPNWALCTRLPNWTSYKRPVTATFRQAGQTADPTRLDDQREVTVDWGWPEVGVTKSLTVADGAVSYTVDGPAGGVEQLPLYLAAEDRLTVDGQPLPAGERPEELATSALQVTRQVGDRSSTATITFTRPVTLRLLRSQYNLARGKVWIYELGLTGEPVTVTFEQA